MRKLILETDSQGNVSVHLHGFKPSIAQDSDAGGELRRSPYGAHLFISLTASSSHLRCPAVPSSAPGSDR